jgi:hypothetical protein
MLVACYTFTHDLWYCKQYHETCSCIVLHITSSYLHFSFSKHLQPSSKLLTVLVLYLHHAYSFWFLSHFDYVSSTCNPHPSYSQVLVLYLHHTYAFRFFHAPTLSTAYSSKTTMLVHTFPHLLSSIFFFP